MQSKRVNYRDEADLQSVWLSFQAPVELPTQQTAHFGKKQSFSVKSWLFIFFPLAELFQISCFKCLKYFLKRLPSSVV